MLRACSLLWTTISMGVTDMLSMRRRKSGLAWHMMCPRLLRKHAHHTKPRARRHAMRAQDNNWKVVNALTHLLTDTLDTGVIDYLTPDNTAVTGIYQLQPLAIPVGGRRWLSAASLPAAEVGWGGSGRSTGTGGSLLHATWSCLQLGARFLAGPLSSCMQPCGMQRGRDPGTGRVAGSHQRRMGPCLECVCRKCVYR